MRNVGYSVELQHDDPFTGPFEYLIEEGRCPAWPGDPGRWDEERVVLGGIERRTGLKGSVVKVRRHPAPSEGVAQGTELRESFWPEAVAAPRKADGLLYTNTSQFIFNKR